MFFSTPFASASLTPTEMIEATISKAVLALKNTSGSQAEKWQAIGLIIDQSFDFRSMSQIPLSEDWKMASREERRLFVSFFSQYIEDTYRSNLILTGDQAIKILSEQIRRTRAVVETLVSSSGKSVQVTYRLKDNGGVIQINYGSSFITQSSQDKRAANAEKIKIYAEKNSLSAEDEALQLYAKKVNEENPIYADVTEVIDHFDRVVELAGIDHVGIGSDYDGVGDSLPYGLKDASSYPNLIYHLLKRGYSEEDIEKICYKNIWRVWSAVEAAAKI